MEEYENIVSYFLRVDNIVNSIAGLGEEVSDNYVVRKVLISLLSRLFPEGSYLEELFEVDKMFMDKLLGNISAYELRVKEENQKSRK